MKIPFAFWGQAESDLPIVAGLKVLSTDLTEAELRFTLVDSGKNEPVYAYGIVYSKTDPKVTLDTPGAQVSPIGTNFPGTLPVTNTHTVTGLDNTSTYYFRVFATNNQGQPQEENTFYSNTATGETAWDAFTFEYNYNYVTNIPLSDGGNPDALYANLGRVSGTVGADVFSYNLTSTGSQQVAVDKGLGTNAVKYKVEDESTGALITKGSFTQESGYSNILLDKSIVPTGTQKILVTIAHDNTVPNSSFNNYRCGEEGSKAAIRVRRWGPAKWKIWDYMFEGSNDNRVNPGNNDPGIGTPVDIPDLSECVSWQSAFRFNQQAWSGDNSNEQKLGDYDLSNIKIALETFKGSNVCGLNVSATTKPLKDANWDNCQVFDQCFDSEGEGLQFNQTKLDVSGWTFNQNSDVISMFKMFFDHAIGQGDINYQMGLANWDVSNVLNFESFLHNGYEFKEDLGSWDVSTAVSMKRMFTNSFRVNFDASSWVVAQVSDYSSFSASANSWVLPQPPFPFIATNSNIEQAITDTLAVDPTGNTAVAPYGAISTWNTSGITDMSDLFEDKTQFNADISNWNVSNVTDMSGMFDDCAAFNQDISGWDTGNVTTMNRMFWDCAAFNQDLSGWDISSLVDPPSSESYNDALKETFRGATSFNTSLNGWVLPPTVVRLQGTFANSGYNAPLDQWDVSNITRMLQVFEVSTFNQDITGWDVSNVTSMGGMFKFNTAFNQEIGNWDVSSLESTNGMFYGATAFNKSLANWNAPNLSQIGEMFRQSNFNQPLPDLTLADDHRGIFYNNTQFNQDISGWDVSGVTLFFYTFRGATSFNQDISNWDVSSCIVFENMFRSATSFQQNLAGWAPTATNNSAANFMTGITLTTTNYDALLIAWAANLDSAYPGGVGYTNTPTFGFGNSVHTTGGPAEAAKNELINTFNWTITDGNP